MKPFLTLLAVTGIAVAPMSAAEQPDFIVINIDDMGYGDIGPFGSKLNRTPNLDRMAHEGRRLTCFYAAPACSPSRSALMTGCYRSGFFQSPECSSPARPSGSIRRNERSRSN